MWKPRKNTQICSCLMLFERLQLFLVVSGGDDVSVCTVDCTASIWLCLVFKIGGVDVNIGQLWSLCVGLLDKACRGPGQRLFWSHETAHCHHWTAPASIVEAFCHSGEQQVANLAMALEKDSDLELPRK